ncbi:MAG: nuclease [Steroidobacteraceae bacterium]
MSVTWIGGLVACASLALAATPAAAWGLRAHSAINRAALAGLPADGPLFLQQHADFIGDSATIPDSWRAISEPFAKLEEDPNHGWFREQFAFLKPIPRSRYEFVLALYREQQRLVKKDPAAARRTNVRWTGTLPFAAMEAYGRLVANLRMYRQAKAAQTDTRFLEQICAFHVMQLAHYIGDGSQPMHNSIHSDGWRGPNPRNYTRDTTIHGRVETQFVELIGMTAADLAPRMGAAGRRDGDLFDAVLAYLDESGSHVERIYQLEQRDAFLHADDAEARALILDRAAAGAAMLRDMIQRAWLESATTPVPPARSPLDEANPAYNGETGSAPAAR